MVTKTRKKLLISNDISVLILCWYRKGLLQLLPLVGRPWLDRK